MPSKPPLHKIIVPKSEKLKKYILSFNVLSPFTDEDEVSYTAFPQRGITVGFFKQSKIRVEDERIIIESDPSSAEKVIFLNKFCSPLKVTYKDFVPKISIHFSELGVNYFFPNYFKNLNKNRLQVEDLSGLNFDETLLFSSKIKESIAHLESELLERFEEQNLDEFRRVLSLLEENPSLENKELAKEISVSEKTLSRYFKKYVGCKISEYKRLSRFRKVVENDFSKEQLKMLFLCYDNGYYDPAHFSKSLSSMTGYTPNKFFKDLEKMGLRNHIYIFD